MKISFTNLGCKVNKYEIDCMSRIAKDNGYEVVGHGEMADIYVINSCAVTNEAEKKSRQYISKLVKNNPKARVLVAGCASQNNMEQFKRDEVVSIMGNFEKSKFLECLNEQRKELFEAETAYDSTLCNPLSTNTRSYLKVQDGCNNFCSYCIIPYIRGRSRSRKIEECVAEAMLLSQKSREIVVTGIDMSSYESGGKLALGDLILALKDVPSRIRVGSLEVGVITREFMEKISKAKNFMPHFHLSLQSGSDSVLKRMNRHYTVKEYLDKVNLIREYYPECNITTDVIVGFAEETIEEFEQTIDTCKKAKFGYIHIFPYSKKTGTVASKIYKDLPKNIKKERVDKLEQVRDELNREYIQKFLGKTVEVLVEDREMDYMVGFSENYIKVYLKGCNESLSGSIVKVNIIEYHAGGAIGEIIC